MCGVMDKDELTCLQMFWTDPVFRAINDATDRKKIPTIALALYPLLTTRTHCTPLFLTQASNQTQVANASATVPQA